MFYIALQMLFGDRGKYIAMVVGLTFATVIMTQQPSIFWGLMSRTYSYITEVSSTADLWIMDPTVQYVEEAKAMRDTEIQRVRGVEGIDWAVPLYQNMIIALLPDGSRKIMGLTGIDDASLVGAPRVMKEGQVIDLRRDDGIILDNIAASDRFARIDAAGKKHPLKIGDTLEINDHRAVIVGISKMQPTFTTIPMAFTTYSRAMRYAPPQRRMMSYILAKVKPGFNPIAVAKQIRAQTNLAAYTVEDFKKINMKYWMDNTGIPINFGIAVLLGFLVGAAIAGQTFFSFMHESMKQFAALKAMGTRNSTLMGMVLLQALVIGLIIYGIGVGLSAFFGWSMRHTVLAFSMPWQLLVSSAAGVLIIVAIAALIGIRTVFRVDPATVFRT